mmetsp:Transcript_79254/g.150542  ORF Transcript_79254/g.150542 Transcript_79254/m.150542 type:complete len:390 (-) Transcript_79254:94-1263(-)
MGARVSRCLDSEEERSQLEAQQPETMGARLFHMGSRSRLSPSRQSENSQARQPLAEGIGILGARVGSTARGCAMNCEEFQEINARVHSFLMDEETGVIQPLGGVGARLCSKVLSGMKITPLTPRGRSDEHQNEPESEPMSVNPQLQSRSADPEIVPVKMEAPSGKKLRDALARASSKKITPRDLSESLDSKASTDYESGSGPQEAPSFEKETVDVQNITMRGLEPEVKSSMPGLHLSASIKPAERKEGSFASAKSQDNEDEVAKSQDNEDEEEVMGVKASLHRGRRLRIGDEDEIQVRATPSEGPTHYHIGSFGEDEGKPASLIENVKKDGVLGGLGHWIQDHIGKSHEDGKAEEAKEKEEEEEEERKLEPSLPRMDWRIFRQSPRVVL